MNSLTKGLYFFFRSNKKQKREIIRIIYLLVKNSLMVKFIPLRYYYNQYFSDFKFIQADRQINYMEIHLIKRIIHNIPWQITCLIESLTVKDFFKNQGLDISISLGLKTDGIVQAHAWYYSENNKGFKRLNSI